MVSSYMPLSYFMVLAIGLWLGKRQAMKGLHVGVEIQQECVLFPLFFIVYMNWIDKCSHTDEYVTIGNC